MKVKYAIAVRAEGINPGEFWPCEYFPHDVRREWPLPESTMDYQEFDSLEAWVEAGGSEWCDGLWDDANFEGGDSVAVVKCQGILDREQAFGFLDSIGAIFEDCDTMGTLGGPANPCGIAPDFSFRTEARAMETSIRLTPVLVDANGNTFIPSRSSWERLHSLLRNANCWDLSVRGRAFA